MTFEHAQFHADAADTFFKKFKGLMGKNSLAADEALLLKGCRSIHCFWMKFSIDAVYLDQDNTVLYVETVPPWHIGNQHVKGTKSILEITAGAGKNIDIGEKACIQNA